MFLLFASPAAEDAAKTPIMKQPSMLAGRLEK